jgi:hypothetical protein
MPGVELSPARAHGCRRSPYVRAAMRGGAGESGQATVEWIGLVLGLALAFGGALGVARGANFGGEADELGEALASRVTCAARDACGAGSGPGARGGALGGRALRAGGLRGGGLRGGARGGALRGGRQWRRPPPALDAFGGRGIRPSAPWEKPPRALAAPGSGVLRALGRAGQHAWVFCLGYRRLRYELDHPRTPRQGVPPREIVDALNECLNPWEFLFP